MNNLKFKTKKVEEQVVKTYKKIEDGVVSGYQATEDSAVGLYQTIENKFVETFLDGDNTKNTNRYGE